MQSTQVAMLNEESNEDLQRCKRAMPEILFEVKRDCEIT